MKAMNVSTTSLAPLVPRNRTARSGRGGEYGGGRGAEDDQNAGNGVPMKGPRFRATSQGGEDDGEEPLL